MIYCMIGNFRGAIKYHQGLDNIIKALVLWKALRIMVLNFVVNPMIIRMSMQEQDKCVLARLLDLTTVIIP